jgi:hypothetical protein
VRHPISRWYLQPAAEWVAGRLSNTGIHPNALTLLNLAAALLAAATLALSPDGTILAGGLILAAWAFDRTDGPLARRQESVSPWGAWLDANVDEFVEVVLHSAAAFHLAYWHGLGWCGPAFAAFMIGKYLFMHGLWSEKQCAPAASLPDHPLAVAGPVRWISRLYHFPANADVRVHLLLAACLVGKVGLVAELVAVGAYYLLRAACRVLLVRGRLRTQASCGRARKPSGAAS